MIGPHHVMTWGSSGEAAPVGAVPAGGAFMRRKRIWWNAAILVLLMVI